MLIKITNVSPALGYDGPLEFYGHLLEDNTIFYDGIVWTLDPMGPFITAADAYMMTSITRTDRGHRAYTMMVVYEEA